MTYTLIQFDFDQIGCFHIFAFFESQSMNWAIRVQEQHCVSIVRIFNMCSNARNFQKSDLGPSIWISKIAFDPKMSVLAKYQKRMQTTVDTLGAPFKKVQKLQRIIFGVKIGIKNSRAMRHWITLENSRNFWDWCSYACNQNTIEIDLFQEDQCRQNW